MPLCSLALAMSTLLHQGLKHSVHSHVFVRERRPQREPSPTYTSLQGARVYLHQLGKLGGGSFSFSGLCSQPLFRVFGPCQRRRIRLLRFPMSSLGAGEIFGAVQQRRRDRLTDQTHERAVVFSSVSQSPSLTYFEAIIRELRVVAVTFERAKP